MTEPSLTGLHGPVYIERALLDAARRELEQIPIRDALGDDIGALERIGYLLLKANSRV